MSLERALFFLHLVLQLHRREQRGISSSQHPAAGVRVSWPSEWHKCCIFMVPEQQLKLVLFQSSTEGLGCDISLKHNERVQFVVLNSLEKSALKQKASNKTKKLEDEIINKKQLVNAGKNISPTFFSMWNKFCSLNTVSQRPMYLVGAPAGSSVRNTRLKWLLSAAWAAPGEGWSIPARCAEVEEEDFCLLLLMGLLCCQLPQESEQNPLISFPEVKRSTNLRQ